MRSLLFAACLVVTAGCSAPAQNEGKAAEAGSPVAIVDGKPITERELLQTVEGELRRLRSEEFEIKSKALDDLIDQRLIEQEAARQKITPQQLMEKEVNANLPELSKEEIKAEYEKYKSRINRPLEEIEPQFRDALRKQRAQELRQTFVEDLRAKAGVRILLDPPRQEVAIDPRRVKGDPKAPVVVVEFSDYQCPFCLKVQPTIRELRNKYAGQVTFAYRDFPLQSIHARATRAAAAARCAAEQGRFWQYHDLLFTNTKQLEEENLRKYASEAGADPAKFESCLESGRYEIEIQKDLNEGAKLGVSGTPSFFINGIMLTGAQPKEEFERVIQSELQRAKQRDGGD